MKPAKQKGEQLLSDIRQARANHPDCLHIWWLGQSGFLACAEGQSVLFDPYLSDSLTRKYAATDKPHDRMTELAIEPGKLDFIDGVTSTHNHTDHLDAETLKPLFEASPDAKLIIPEANRSFVAERLGVAEDWPVGLNDGQEVSIGDVRFVGMPAAHNEVDRDKQGRCLYMGYVLHIGKWSIYHSGDTRPINGLANLLKPHALDVALLPINGMLEERRVSGNLWGQEAAALAHNAGCKCVIPCHYDMFTFNTESPQAFIEACERRNQNYRVLEVGERFSLHADQS